MSMRVRALDPLLLKRRPRSRAGVRSSAGCVMQPDAGVDADADGTNEGDAGREGVIARVKAGWRWWCGVGSWVGTQ